MVNEDRVVKLIKGIINDKENKTRPILKTIQQTKMGEDFICSSTQAVKWKIEKLDNIAERTGYEHSVGIDTIFGNFPRYEITEQDKMIITNIDKVKKYIRELKGEKKDRHYFVELCNKFFDLPAVENVFKILVCYDKKLKNTTFSTENEKNRFLQLENEDIKGVVCPIVLVEEDSKKAKEMTIEIIKRLVKKEI